MILDKTPLFGYESKSRFKNYDDRMNIHELDGLPNDLKNAVIEQTKSIACLIKLSRFVDLALHSFEFLAILSNNKVLVLGYFEDLDLT